MGRTCNHKHTHEEKYRIDMGINTWNITLESSVFFSNDYNSRFPKRHYILQLTTVLSVVINKLLNGQILSHHALGSITHFVYIIMCRYTGSHGTWKTKAPAL